MKNRPEIALKSPEQVEAVYEYYENYTPPRIVSQLAWRAFNLGYRPEVSFLDEEAEEQFHAIRSSGTPHIITSNHLTDFHDPLVIGASLRQTMPEAAGRIRILTKDPVMRKMGKFSDMLGGIPAFRTKDHAIDREIIVASADALAKCCGNLLASEQDIMLFPAGTHMAEQGSVKPGIAHIGLHAAALGAAPAVTNLGMSFRERSGKQRYRHAAVVIGPSFDISAGDSIESILERTRYGMAVSAEAAQLLHQKS